MFSLYYDFFLYVNIKAANILSAVLMSGVVTTLTGLRVLSRVNIKAANILSAVLMSLVITTLSRVKGLKYTKHEVIRLEWCYCVCSLLDIRSRFLRRTKELVVELTVYFPVVKSSCRL